MGQNWFIDTTKEVRAEHVYAFVVPTLYILKRMGNIDASIKEVRKGKGRRILHPISIVIGFIGDLKGTFIIRFEELTACAIGARWNHCSFGKRGFFDEQEGGKACRAKSVF